MAFEDLLTQICDIQRKTTIIGSRGQSEVTWTTVEEEILCNVQMETIVREEYNVIDRGERSLTSFTGYFEYGTDIKEGDKVIVDSPNATFHVDRVHPDTIGRADHIEADLELIKEN
jgi:hypothetical protein